MAEFGREQDGKGAVGRPKSESELQPMQKQEYRRAAAGGDSGGGQSGAFGGVVGEGQGPAGAGANALEATPKDAKFVHRVQGALLLEDLATGKYLRISDPLGKNTDGSLKIEPQSTVVEVSTREVSRLSLACKSSYLLLFILFCYYYYSVSSLD